MLKHVLTTRPKELRSSLDRDRITYKVHDELPIFQQMGAYRDREIKRGGVPSVVANWTGLNDSLFWAKYRLPYPSHSLLSLLHPYLSSSTEGKKKGGHE